MVKLISISSPQVEGENHSMLSAEQFIVYIARVSNPSNQLNTATSEKLLKYLIKHKHWSPFEHVYITVEIKTSRAIAAQILRHRSFTFQEFSQRYSESTTLEDLEWRMQGKSNRQVGEDVINLNVVDKGMVDAAQKACLKTYEYLLSIGIAKECARMVLPLNTSTTIYMTGSLRSWVHYLFIRNTKETQKEHRVIAQQIQDILKEKFPITFTSLKSE
jgi:thymidylate synthase (FAD)